jgi:Protein of unknown function (DUF2939)
MLRFVLRHFTAILIIVAIAVWALVYLPQSPSVAVFRMKQAIDARNGDEAAKYVDFESVVKHAGYEMVQKRGGGDPMSSMIGNAAIDLFTKPMAQIAKAWSVRKVNDGDKDVQMPDAAVAGAIVLLHRSGDTAYTDFKDHKGQEWEIHLARGDDGQWRVVEVKNVEQLLEKLQREEDKNLNAP